MKSAEAVVGVVAGTWSAGATLLWIAALREGYRQRSAVSSGGMDDEKQRRGSQEPAEQPLREEDVTVADKLDDRVSEAEGLPEPLDPTTPADR